LTRHLPESECLDMLDAGCGTGLCAPLLRAHASHLVGVDLSSGMIEKARQRGGYDELVVAELTAFMQDRPASFDVIVSADTLIYFGDLTPVMHAASQALRPGGRLAFTLEAAADDTAQIVLGPSGRYQHGRDHLLHVLDQAGL